MEPMQDGRWTTDGTRANNMTLCQQNNDFCCVMLCANCSSPGDSHISQRLIADSAPIPTLFHKGLHNIKGPDRHIQADIDPMQHNTDAHKHQKQQLPQIGPGTCIKLICKLINFNLINFAQNLMTRNTLYDQQRPASSDNPAWLTNSVQRLKAGRWTLLSMLHF